AEHGERAAQQSAPDPAATALGADRRGHGVGRCRGVERAHESRILGLSQPYVMSTPRLTIATISVATIRLPWMTGMSRWETAWTRSEPMPGTANTRSIATVSPIAPA